MSSAPGFSVKILGSNSALPAYDRHPSAQLLNVNNQYYLIDCGEGTQMQLRKYGIKMQRIDVVFISHLHGDHYFGLIGLLNSLHLLGRKSELKIVCPSGLKEILDIQMEAAKGRLQFPISYIFTDEVRGVTEATHLYSDKHVKVYAFPLKHRIHCCGFLFCETAKPATFRPEMIERYGIPLAAISGIKKGEDFKAVDGRIIPHTELTYPAPEPRSYAYCTDTAPLSHLSRFVGGANLLYHEATFTDSLADRARETFHSTATQAATVAASCGVSRLLIGHFSARYKSLEEFTEQARAVFEASELAIEGEEYNIPHNS